MVVATVARVVAGVVSRMTTVARVVAGEVDGVVSRVTTVARVVAGVPAAATLAAGPAVNVVGTAGDGGAVAAAMGSITAAGAAGPDSPPPHAAVAIPSQKPRPVQLGPIPSMLRLPRVGPERDRHLNDRHAGWPT